MSYSCTVAFKSIEPSKVFEFLTNFKKEAINHFEEIAEDEYFYHPISKDFHYNDIDEAVKNHDYMYKGADWARDYVFKYRYFYIPEYNLLGIFGPSKCMNYLFNNVSYFQNSCDQDYDFEDWNGITLFEAIANKWKNMTDEDVKKAFYSDGWHDEDDECDCDYYRRSYCYDEIWGIVGKYFEDESTIIYFSLFGNYELFELTQFSSICMHKYQDWIHELNKKFAKKEADKNEENNQPEL